MFPYVQKVKLVSFVKDQFERVQKVNLKNAIHVFSAFMTGKKAFPDFQEKPWCSDLNSRLDQLQSIKL